MRVLVIAEDFRKDEMILVPIIEAMFAQIGKPHAIVRVCRDPFLAGIEEVMKEENLLEIVDRYPMVSVFLLVVDRDGNSSRKKRLERRELVIRKRLAGTRRVFFAENAWQELEVWALATEKLPPAWRWRDIRNHPNPKEHYFEKYVDMMNIENEPGEGRQSLAQNAARNFGTLRLKCEEVRQLEQRIRDWIAEDR